MLLGVSLWFQKQYVTRIETKSFKYTFGLAMI